MMFTIRVTHLITTTHESERGAYFELEAWRERMKLGEVSRIELIDNRPNGHLSGRVYDDTEIEWSWQRGDAEPAGTVDGQGASVLGNEE